MYAFRKPCNMFTLKYTCARPFAKPFTDAKKYTEAYTRTNMQAHRSQLLGRCYWIVQRFHQGSQSFALRAHAHELRRLSSSLTPGVQLKVNFSVRTCMAEWYAPTNAMRTRTRAHTHTLYLFSPALHKSDGMMEGDWNTHILQVPQRRVTCRWLSDSQANLSPPQPFQNSTPWSVHNVSQLINVNWTYENLILENSVFWLGSKHPR